MVAKRLAGPWPRGGLMLKACISGLVCVLAMWTGTAAVHGQVPGSFRQIDLDGGGWVTGFAAHGSGRLYARTDVGGLYRSDDSGDSWQYLSGDFTSHAGLMVQGVAVSSISADTLMICCGSSYTTSDPSRGVWKSTNGGSSWTQVLANVNFSGNDDPRYGGPCVVFRHGSESEAWVATRQGGVYRTLDGGGSWTKLGGSTFDGVVLCSIALHPTTADEVWVAGAGGAWRSTNGGASFTLVQPLTMGYRVAINNAGVVMVAGDTALWRFRNQSWSNLAGQFSGWGDMVALHVLGNGVDFVASRMGSPTRRSTDGGDTWTTLAMAITGPVPPAQLPDAQMFWSRNELLQDPTNPSRFYLSGGGGPFRSSDAGATWQYMINGIGEVVVWKVRFHPTDPNVVTVPCADVIGYVLTDAGSPGATDRNPRRAFSDMTFGSAAMASGNTVIFGGGAYWGSRAGQPLMVKSTDLGQTWAELPTSGLPSQLPIIGGVMLDNDPQTMVLAVGGTTGSGGGGIYRSTNGGASFTRASGIDNGIWAGDQFNQWLDICLDRQQPGRMFAMLRGSGFYRSTDNGATWTKTASSGIRSNWGSMAADAARAAEAWLALPGVGIDRTTNGGNTWMGVSNFVDATAIDVYDRRIAVIGRRPGDTFQKIYYSADAGANWAEVTRAGYRFGNAQAVAVDPHRPGQVWVSTNGRSLAVFVPATPTPTPSATATPPATSTPTPSALPVPSATPTPTAAALLLTQASSVKTHQGLAEAVPLPLSLVAVGGEPRSGPLRLVLMFNLPPVDVGSGPITASNIEIRRWSDLALIAGASASCATNGTSLTIDLTGIDPSTRLRVRLVNLMTSSGRPLSGVSHVDLNVLEADVDNSGMVDGADLAAIKQQLGPLNSTSPVDRIRADTDRSAKVTLSDLAAAKAAIGTALP